METNIIRLAFSIKNWYQIINHWCMCGSINYVLPNVGTQIVCALMHVMTVKPVSIYRYLLLSTNTASWTSEVKKNQQQEQPIHGIQKICRNYRKHTKLHLNGAQRSMWGWVRKGETNKWNKIKEQKNAPAKYIHVGFANRKTMVHVLPPKKYIYVSFIYLFIMATSSLSLPLPKSTLNYSSIYGYIDVVFICVCVCVRVSVLYMFRNIRDVAERLCQRNE